MQIKCSARRLAPVLVFGVLVTLMSSCAKLPVYKSDKLALGEEDIFESIVTDKYDKNNIHFGMAADQNSFYFKAIFHKEENSEAIMRNGLTIYFDPKCKKKKNYSLKIEKSEDSQGQRQRQGQGQGMSGMQSGGSSSSMQGPGRMGDISSIINKELKKVTWSVNDEDFVFYRDIHQYEITVDFKSNEDSELVMELKMPLSEIPFAAANSFSMGLETSSSSASSGGMSGGMSGGPGGGMGGGMSGGMSGMGGGMRGGMGGGGMSGSGMGGRPSSSSSSSFKMWFEVETLNLNE